MINVVPLNDLKPHIDESMCDCKPSLIIENGEMILVHNSFDKRELNENKNVDMTKDFKVGDTVTIIPDADHPEFVKKNYGKVLKVQKAIETGTGDGEYLYKIGNIPDYATINDLKPYKEQ